MMKKAKVQEIRAGDWLRLSHVEQKRLRIGPWVLVKKTTIGPYSTEIFLEGLSITKKNSCLPSICVSDEPVASYPYRPEPSYRGRA